MWVLLNSKSTSWNLVERLIFPAPAASYTIDSFPDELILIPREDGLQVPCLFLPFKHARFLVIYFHANAEDLGLSYPFITIIRDLFQVNVLAVEYPGYGICPGRTDEAGIMANAVCAMRFATETIGWPPDGIKLFGRSLGTGPTVALATEYDVAGVILVSPFLSIRTLFRCKVGRLAEMVDDRFSNESLATKIRSPTLIIHGQQDALIPLEHGRRIYESVPTRKMMVCPASMEHNTSLLRSVGTFVLPMTQFFSLPDYTFESIEVPHWVFPSLSQKIDEKVAEEAEAAMAWHQAERRKLDESLSPTQAEAAALLAATSAVRRVSTPPWGEVSATGAGLLLPQSFAAQLRTLEQRGVVADYVAGRGASQGLRPASQPLMRILGGGLEDSRTDLLEDSIAPAEQGDRRVRNYGLGPAITVSRSYDFRTPPSPYGTPRNDARGNLASSWRHILMANGTYQHDAARQQTCLPDFSDQAPWTARTLDACMSRPNRSNSFSDDEEVRTQKAFEDSSELLRRYHL
mmetsp:Transcript_28286/g.61766  ORF Transcript_28286/g.61766 Transcript_28286/m.61766 type:complete len:518 (+) Transcript_28286:160-1713(+)